MFGLPESRSFEVRHLRRDVALRAMGSMVIVALTPTLNHDPGFGQAPEDLSIEAFPAEGAVEA